MSSALHSAPVSWTADPTGVSTFWSLEMQALKISKAFQYCWSPHSIWNTVKTLGALVRLCYIHTPQWVNHNTGCLWSESVDRKSLTFNKVRRLSQRSTWEQWQKERCKSGILTLRPHPQTHWLFSLHTRCCILLNKNSYSFSRHVIFSIFPKTTRVTTAKKVHENWNK